MQKYLENKKGVMIMTVGKNVRIRRQKLGLHQSELAQRAGTTQAQISRLENDKSNVSVNLLRKVSIVLRCSVNDLIGTEDKSA